jgi:hypothetical protein
MRGIRGGWRAMTTTLRRWPVVVVAVASTGACGTGAGDDEVVARVDSYSLTVADAVDLLVDEERLAADAGVIESLAELWVDYTLLADAAARDTTFGQLDFAPLVEQQINQVMVFQLRDSVIQVDTFVTDDELRERYEADAPRTEVRARHIMVRIPIGATQAQRDSVQSMVSELGDRIAAGESFEALARQHSQDPGTAPAGGDLGYFQRGDMVAPFEEVVFSLQVGEVSGVVRTPVGFHLIRLDDRRTPDFAEVAGQFRTEVQGRLIEEAESLFVSSLVEGAGPRVADGAYDIVREMAQNPGARLSGRAARRRLVDWTTGSVTVAGVRDVLQIESPAFRSQLASGSDDGIDDFLHSLARRDLLVSEAEGAGLRPAGDSIEVLVDDARGQLRDAARRLGLLELDRAPGERLEVAVSRAVEGALAGNLSGATRVVPLGLIGFQLREGRSIAVLEGGVGQVIVEVARIRVGRGLPPLQPGPDTVVGPDSAR